jgi:hypothetical protein
MPSAWFSCTFKARKEQMRAAMTCMELKFMCQGAILM